MLASAWALGSVTNLTPFSPLYYNLFLFFKIIFTYFIFTDPKGEGERIKKEKRPF